MTSQKIIMSYLLDSLKELNEDKIIRTIQKDNQTWYAAVDITKGMGYANSFKAIVDHCNENGILRVKYNEDLDNSRHVLYINEENIFKLVLASKRKEVREIQNWLFESMYLTCKSVKATSSLKDQISKTKK